MFTLMLKLIPVSELSTCLYSKAALRINISLISWHAQFTFTYIKEKSNSTSSQTMWPYSAIIQNVCYLRSYWRRHVRGLLVKFEKRVSHINRKWPHWFTKQERVKLIYQPLPGDTYYILWIKHGRVHGN